MNRTEKVNDRKEDESYMMRWNVRESGESYIERWIVHSIIDEKVNRTWQGESYMKRWIIVNTWKVKSLMQKKVNPTEKGIFQVKVNQKRWIVNHIIYRNESYSKTITKHTVLGESYRKRWIVLEKLILK